MPVWVPLVGRLTGAALNSTLLRAGKLVVAAATGDKAFVRRALIRAVAPRMIQHGVSINSALGMIRRAGFGINTQAFYRLMASHRGIHQAKQFARRYARDKAIRVGMLPKWGNPPRGFHNAIIRYRFTDPLTGRDRFGFWTHRFKAGQTRRKVENDAVSHMEDVIAGRVAKTPEFETTNAEFDMVVALFN